MAEGERREDSVTDIKTAPRSRPTCQPKEWTFGVGMVLEWYYETMPSGHVASPALRVERKRIGVPTVTNAMSHQHCHFLPKWIRLSWALGQGKARTLDDWFHGCGQFSSVA